MSSYNNFAAFYDKLTENVDYKVRSEYISDFFSRYNGIKSVLDLACGTGSVSKCLADKGYSITGIDLSADMLTVAASKGIPNLQLIMGDMTDFELPYKVDNCVCSLDAINHLTDFDKVLKCFKCVFNALNDGGVFVFDVNTQFKHRQVLFNNTFIFDEDEFFLAWDNSYRDNDIVDIYLDFFVYNGKNYDRFSENITERAYSIDSLTEGLIYCGFEIIGIYDELTEDSPREDSERVYFVCRKGSNNE